jgi:hypothetical protein
MLEPGAHQDQVNRAEAAAQRAVERTLTMLGFDLTDPIKAQGQMAALRILAERVDDKEFMADAAFTRNLRNRFEVVTETGIKAAVRWAVGGLLALVVLGITVYYRKPF